MDGGPFTYSYLLHILEETCTPMTLISGISEPQSLYMYVCTYIGMPHAKNLDIPHTHTHVHPHAYTHTHTHVIHSLFDRLHNNKVI